MRPCMYHAHNTVSTAQITRDLEQAKKRISVQPERGEIGIGPIAASVYTHESGSRT